MITVRKLTKQERLKNGGMDYFFQFGSLEAHCTKGAIRKLKRALDNLDKVQISELKTRVKLLQEQNEELENSNSSLYEQIAGEDI